MKQGMAEMMNEMCLGMAGGGEAAGRASEGRARLQTDPCDSGSGWLWLEGWWEE